MVRNLPAMWETCVRSLDQEDPLEKELATHSSVLAWRIPWTEEPGGPWGGKESGTTERLPDETVTCSWGERATRHAFSCVLREVTFDPSPSFLPLFTFGCVGSSLLSPSHLQGFPGGSDSKESACSARDLGSIPGSGRSPGEGNGNPLQNPCLENSMDRGAWWATVQRDRHD